MNTTNTRNPKSSSTAARLRQKKARRRKLALIRFIILMIIIFIFIFLINTVSFAVRSILHKDPVFTTDLTDSVIPKVSTVLSAQEQNDLVSIAAITAPDPKVCYLTFDDGPNNSVTIQISDILRRYNAKATFFQVGSLIESYPDVTRRLHNEGHLIANHSFAHNYSELYASTDSFMSEIKQTEEIIKNTIGEEPFKLVRFPGGSYNSGKYSEIKQQCKEVLKNNDYFHSDWNCLTGDAEGGKKTPEELLERLKETLKNQPQAIILMHDTISKQSTVDALPDIMDYLISQGYTFDTLDHLRTN